AYIDNRDIEISELMEHVKGPDFPTGGLIYGYTGVKDAFETGRGRIVMRAKAEIETSKDGRETIVVTEIPYLVNKADMIKRTAELVQEKKLEGISAIKDESAKDIRIVYDIKRDANRSEEHTSELQSRENLVCRLLLEKKKKIRTINEA